MSNVAGRAPLCVRRGLALTVPMDTRFLVTESNGWLHRCSVASVTSSFVCDIDACCGRGVVRAKISTQDEKTFAPKEGQEQS